jgi:hypothetical protein
MAIYTIFFAIQPASSGFAPQTLHWKMLFIVTLHPPASFEELSELNRNEDKTQVVRNKILKYYFVGDFDVTPFANMPVSVVPEVISQIRCETKQSAIFRLLKSIPELSSVTNRCLETEQSSKAKRQKTDTKK